MPDVVLITGVSRYLGGAFARALSQVEGGPTRIIGVDVIPPPHPIGRAEFLRADIRSPMIGKIIEASAVDTVVHMGVIATPIASGGRATQKEINVIGTMQLLAACQKAASVQRLVVKSTAGVYGSSHRDPAMFTEDMAAKRLPNVGFGKDSVEVEAYVRGFARRRPDVGITMLRLANVIGPRMKTAMTDYFRLPVIPIPLGWDARLQFVHEDDVALAMVTATMSEPAGTVNVAGDGIITVSQAVALTGRPFVAIPSPASRDSRDLQAHRPDRFLSGATRSARARPRARHHPDARRARLRAGLHDPRSFQGFRVCRAPPPRLRAARHGARDRGHRLEGLQPRCCRADRA